MTHAARGPLRAALVLPLAALALGAADARADTITYAFQGEISTLTADDGLFGLPSATALGQTITGHFSYETGPGNPDQMPADPEAGLYDGLELVIDQAAVPLTLLAVGVLHEAPLATVPPAPPDLGTDAFVVLAQAPGYSGVTLRLAAPYGQVFSDDSLPTSLDPADFTESRLRGLVQIGIMTPSIEDVARIGSLTRVPEPGLLALVGLCGLAVARRARR